MPPAKEGASKSSAKQVKKVDDKTKPTTRESKAKSDFQSKLASEMPQKVQHAMDFKKNKKAKGIIGAAESVIKVDSGNVTNTYGAIKNPPAPQNGPNAIPLGGIEQAKPTAKMDLGKDLIAPLQPQHTDFSSYEKQSDEALAKEGITDEHLNMVDSGELLEAKNNRQELKTTSKNANSEIDGVRKTATEKVDKRLKKEENFKRMQMQGARDKQLKDARNEQEQVKSELEKKREAVANKVQSMYTQTKTSVETKLNALNNSSLKTFESGQKKAAGEFENNVERRIKAFKKKRYKGLRGKWRWVKDKFKGINKLSEVKEILESEKKTFVNKIDKLIADITVKNKQVIEECKTQVANARLQIDEYVNGLDPELKAAGEKAQNSIQEKLDKLDSDIDTKEKELANLLETKKEEAIRAIEEKIEEMKKKMGGLLGKILNFLLDAALKFLKWALQSVGLDPDPFINTIKRVVGVIIKIIKKPLQFLSNLVAAVKGGFQDFFGNLGENVMDVVMTWLTGKLQGSGLELPAQMNGSGILKMVLSVLGLTWENIEFKLTEKLGSGTMDIIMNGADIVKALISGGPGAMWEVIQEKIKEIALPAVADHAQNAVNNAVGGEENAQNIGNMGTGDVGDFVQGVADNAGENLPDYVVEEVRKMGWGFLRAKLVDKFGEGAVSTMETVADMVKRVISDGPGALMDILQEKGGVLLSNLKDMVLKGIKDWAITKLIKEGIKKLLSFLVPGGGFIQTLVSIYQSVMFFIENSGKLGQLVGAVLGSIGDVAEGNVGGAIAKISKAIKLALALLLDFIAKLLNLDGIVDKIQEIVSKAREWVDKMIDKVLDWIIGGIRKFFEVVKNFLVDLKNSLFGGGDEEEEDEGQGQYPEYEDPEKTEKVHAGLNALKAEQAQHLNGNKITLENAMATAVKIKSAHPVFSSLTAIDGSEVPSSVPYELSNKENSYVYRYTASPENFLIAGEKDEETTATNVDWTSFIKDGKIDDADILKTVNDNRGTIPDHSDKLRSHANGQWYGGSTDVDPTDLQDAEGIREKIQKVIWDELEKEGTCSSINTWDGETFTWGRGFAGTGLLNDVIKELFSSSSTIKTQFINIGIAMDSNNKLVVVDGANGNISSGTSGLTLIKNSNPLLSFFIEVASHDDSKQDVADAQFEIMKDNAADVPDYTYDESSNAYKGNWSDDSIRLLAHLSHWMGNGGWTVHKDSFQDTNGDLLKIIATYSKNLQSKTSAVNKQSNDAFLYQDMYKLGHRLDDFAGGVGKTAVKSVCPNPVAIGGNKVSTDARYADYILFKEESNKYWIIPKSGSGTIPANVLQDNVSHGLINKSVGAGGDNEAADVTATLNKLHELGFITEEDKTKTDEASLDAFIRDYQDKTGACTPDGKMSPGYKTEEFMVKGIKTKEEGENAGNENETTETTTENKIGLVAASVGRGGVNNAEDVTATLNKLAELGVITDEEKTKTDETSVGDFIERYQKMVFNNVDDGLMSNDGTTEEKLNAGVTEKAGGGTATDQDNGDGNTTVLYRGRAKKSYNVRKGPATSFDKYDTGLTADQEVDVFDEKNGWVRIGEARWASAGSTFFERIEEVVPEVTPEEVMDQAWACYEEGQSDMIALAAALVPYGGSHPDKIIEIMDKLPGNHRDNLAYAMADKVDDTTLGTFDKGLLERMASELDGMWNTTNWGANYEMRDRINQILGNWEDAAAKFSRLWQKSTLTLEEVGEAREYIESLTDPSLKAQYYLELQEKTQYFDQRENSDYVGEDPTDGGSCNLASLGMCLQVLGLGIPSSYQNMDGFPSNENFIHQLEFVRRNTAGAGARTTRDGWEKVAEACGATSHEVAWNKTAGKDWFDTNVKDAHLAKGHAIMTSIHSHIVRIQAITSSGIVVDDPFGESKLKAGTARGWDDRNESDLHGKDDGNGDVGEDHVWPWADVEKSEFFWIFAFSV